MRGAVVAASVLQGVFDPVHVGGDILLEIGVERFVHAAEQGRRHGGAAKYDVLDGIDPGGHPSAADEGLVRFGLAAGRALHRCVVQPNVRDVEAGEHTARCGLPGDPEQVSLDIEKFLSAGRPDALLDHVFDSEALAAAPDADGSVEGQRLLADLALSALLRFATGNDHPLVVLEVQFFQLPDFAFAKAVARFVFEKKNVVLSGRDSFAAIAMRLFLLTTAAAAEGISPAAWVTSRIFPWEALRQEKFAGAFSILQDACESTIAPPGRL